MTKLFGTDGIRGRGEWIITTNLAAELGAAVACIADTVVVASDTRLTSPVIERQLIKGLVGGGVRVLRVGVLPTPACAYLTKYYGADYGIMITASHNPPSYNGIKFFGSGGRKLSAEAERQIERIVGGGVFKRGSGDTVKKEGAKEAYLDYVATRVGSLEGAEVTLDCCHGATTAVAPELFRRLGARVRCLCGSADGELINVYSGSTNLEYIKGNTDGLGFAFDGDGDRVLGVVGGKTIDGDNMLYCLAIEYKGRGELTGNVVVGTKMTNTRLIELLGEEGISVEIADVGDKFVMEVMEKTGAVLGGENSGHIISGGLSTGDGVLTAALLTKLYMKNKQLFEGYEPYTQLQCNLPYGKEVANYAAVQAAQAECEELLKGIGRLLVRASGTEPVLRLMVESKNETVATAVMDKLKKAFLSAVTK